MGHSEGCSEEDVPVTDPTRQHPERVTKTPGLEGSTGVRTQVGRSNFGFVFRVTLQSGGI